MADDKKQKVINLLIDLYKSNGFITEDEIFALSSNEQLSFLEINYVTEYLLLRGVVISEAKDKIFSKKGRGYRRDYSKFFEKIGKRYKSLKSFLKYYDKIDPLAENEWITLIQQSRRGNVWARNRLFDTSMQKAIRQAYMVSKKYDLDFEDVLQSASFGILYAIDSFDETEHSTLLSYIPLAINSRVRREAYLPSNPLISFPVEFMNVFFRIYPLIKKHICNECCHNEKVLFCETLNKQIQNKFEYSHKEIIEYIQYFQTLDCISEDIIVDDQNIFSNIREHEIKKVVLELLSRLKPQEEQVIKMRYGIDCDASSLESIARQKSVTKQRIQQIEAKTMEKLTHLAVYVLKLKDVI